MLNLKGDVPPLSRLGSIKNRKYVGIFLEFALWLKI